MNWWEKTPPVSSRFRRNVCIIGAAHVLAILAIFGWGKWRGAPQPPAPQDVTWLDGGGLAALAAQKETTSPAAAPAEEKKPAEPEPEPEKMPEPEPVEKTPDPEPDTPSDLVMATPTPQPTPEHKPTPAPTPKPTPKATPKPSPTPTPKPKPKPSPKASPKPSPKASPKPSASPKSSPKKETAAASAKPSAKSSASPKAKVTPAGENGAGTAAKAAFKNATGKAGSAGDVGTAAGTGGGNRGGAGKAGGGNRETDFGWYHAMIHDRFYAHWEQPTSIVSSDQKFVTTVKLRIEKSGKVSEVTLANGSGNVVMDESVMEAARKVTQIDPLPAGLGGDFYEVKIQFELSQQQQ